MHDRGAGRSRQTWRGWVPAARLVTSDLVRAVETAQIVGKRIGLVPELDARLCEQHLGELEGRSYENSWARAKLHDWSDPELPLTGVSRSGRCAAAWPQSWRDLAPGTPTVLISHGDAIRCALAQVPESQQQVLGLPVRDLSTL
jgi:probable phosphoglycerate mutase